MFKISKISKITLWVFLLMPAWVMANPNPGIYRTQAQGATSINELSNGIIQALQSNNFDQLSNFLPTDTELTLLKKRGSEDMKALLENLSAVDIQLKLKTDFQALIQTGIGNTLNWSEMTLAESQPGKSSPKNKVLKPVTIVLNTKQNRTVSIIYEAVRLNNRFFLFRRIQIKS